MNRADKINLAACGFLAACMIAPIVFAPVMTHEAPPPPATYALIAETAGGNAYALETGVTLSDCAALLPDVQSAFAYAGCEQEPTAGESPVWHLVSETGGAFTLHQSALTLPQCDRAADEMKRREGKGGAPSFDVLYCDNTAYQGDSE